MLGMADLPPESLAHPTPPRAHPEQVTTAPVRIASAEAATAVAREPNARGVVWSHLPTPNRVAAEVPLPPLHHPLDLRALVGRRIKRDAFTETLAWSHALGSHIDAPNGPSLAAAASAEADAIEPGDLLIFDRTEGAPADLVAIAIARDARHVTEFIYLAGGVVRRGFLDPARPSLRRDSSGLVVNTFLRAGNRWPPSGTHYLAGELLAHVVHSR